MSQKNKTRALGLDIGTSRIVAARQEADGIRFESQLNAFVSIPFSKMTAGVLARENVPHVVRNGEIVVQGNEAERFAELLDGEIRRPMTRGVLNPAEPESLQMIRQMAVALVGQATAEGQKLCFSVPAAPRGADENLAYHQTGLSEALAELGFQVSSINEGLAVVYSELESTNYTGIGISCGGGLCNVCLAYLSMPVLTFSVAKAGDFVDAGAASVTGERANRMRILKEQSFYFNGASPDALHRAINVYYDDMIQALVGNLREAFTTHHGIPRLRGPIPLVLSGGTAIPKGFRERFEKCLQEKQFPVPIAEVRLAGDPLTATARGALVAALADF